MRLSRPTAGRMSPASDDLGTPSPCCPIVMRLQDGAPASLDQQRVVYEPPMELALRRHQPAH